MRSLVFDFFDLKIALENVRVLRLAQEIGVELRQRPHQPHCQQRSRELLSWPSDLSPRGTKPWPDGHVEIPGDPLPHGVRARPVVMREGEILTGRGGVAGGGGHPEAWGGGCFCALPTVGTLELNRPALIIIIQRGCANTVRSS